MREREIKNYKALNGISQQNCTVIFGGTNDLKLPLCELCQGFDLKENCCNRSFENLTADEAVKLYNTCIAELFPESVFLHIEDIKGFKTSAEKFAKDYTNLIWQIKKDNKNCRIAVVSAKNYNNDRDIEEFNKQLKYIADSEKCEFCDISKKRVFNPTQTKEVASFVYNLGFVHPLKCKRPLADLAKILFCFGQQA